MIYITGDTHGDFRQVAQFCEKVKTTKDDILIILGDAGINYYGNPKDKRLKRGLSELPVTFFCIHGNHEKRPESVLGYEEVDWRGGKVFIESEFPSIMFAKDGEVFDIGGKRCIVIGGAYSVDKYYRLANKWSWWADEQPSDEIKARVEKKLDRVKWKVDAVFSHTYPLKYVLTEVFLDFIDQSTVDNSTEIWLDEIEDKLDYNEWYCGHFHTDKSIDKVLFFYKQFREIFGEPIRILS
jgi:3-oxoacid CoA-transferase subunit A